MNAALLAQMGQYEMRSEGPGIIPIVIGLAVVVVIIAGMWKVFAKAGEPGWACIVPIYNVWVLLKIAGRPGWWIVLYFVPIVSLIVTIIVSIDIAKAFGKGTGFGIGLALLSPIFYPILGFGDAQFGGGSAKPAA